MPISLIDTHCHLDSEAFDADRERLVAQVRAFSQYDALVCAGFVSGFDKTRRVAHSLDLHYALGIHPLYLPQLQEQQVRSLEIQLEVSQDDPRLAAVGEIGIDGFVKDLNLAAQTRLFAAQLKLARRFALPVSIHARHAVDAVTAQLRRLPVVGGVIHAFNGSEQQARTLLAMGLKLGFGGALTYAGSKRIRRIFAMLPDTGFVLETDAPDMPGTLRQDLADRRTHPADILHYAQEAAAIRGVSRDQLLAQAAANALEAFPRLKSAHRCL